MFNVKIIKNLAVSLILVANFAYANTNASVEFFSSNNTKEISLEKAYWRMVSKVQTNLQNATIQDMQKYHVEQGTFHNVLGTYKMSTDNNMTADNSQVFVTSPYQTLSYDQAVTVAQQLAVDLKQDSIAVFIPDENQQSGEIIMRFTQNRPSINQAIEQIKRRLPDSYSEAFSLHLSNTRLGFNQATVNAVEWLGSSAKVDDIKRAFPQAVVTVQNGSAYLVYKDHVDPL